MNLLVVSAWSPEHRAMKWCLDGREKSPMPPEGPWVPPWTEREVAWSEEIFQSEGVQQLKSLSVSFLCTGVGSILAYEKVLSALRYDSWHGVVFMGTAGVYGPHECGGPSVQWAHRSLWTDGAAALGQSYFPGPTPKGQVCAHSPSEGFWQGGEGVVVSTPSITHSLEVAKALGALGQLENLEVYGVFKAAQMAGVPALACLGVSNAVGPEAHREWKKWHLEASLMAQKSLLERLQTFSR